VFTPLIFNDLLELADKLLWKFPTFIPVLNDLKPQEISIDVPNIPIFFVPLTNVNYVTNITFDRKKYVLAIVNNSITGYVKQKWVKMSPQVVYPVFYNGQYTGDVFLNRKEAIYCALDIKEELRLECVTFDN